MATPDIVELESGKFLHKVIQEYKDEPPTLAAKLSVILQHMRSSGKENSMQYQVISRAMETLISEHGLDIEDLNSTPLTGVGDLSSTQFAVKDSSQTAAIAKDRKSGMDENEMANLNASSRRPVGPTGAGHDIRQESLSRLSSKSLDHENPSNYDARSHSYLSQDILGSFGLREIYQLFGFLSSSTEDIFMHHSTVSLGSSASGEVHGAAPGGVTVQLDSWGQPSLNAVNYGMNIERNEVSSFLPNLEPLHNGGVTMQIDSLDQPSMDAINDGMEVVSERENSVVTSSKEESTRKTQEKEHKKTGVRINISLEDILRCAKMSRHEAARKLEVSISTLKRVCRDYGIHRWPPRKLNKVSSFRTSSVDQEEISQLTSNLTSNQALACVPRTNSHDAVMQATTSLPPGARIEISAEDIVRTLNVDIKDAAAALNVSVSTLKSVRREYGIRRWPPRKIERVPLSRTLPVEDQKQIQLNSDPPSNQASAKDQEQIQLNSDPPSNQASAIVARIKPHDSAFQDAKMVTIKAKYRDDITIKFGLPLSSGLVELQQQVGKRLGLEAGTYYITYTDEEDERILIACDHDLKDCIHYSKTQGKTSVVVYLEPK